MDELHEHLHGIPSYNEKHSGSWLQSWTGTGVAHKTITATYLPNSGIIIDKTDAQGYLYFQDNPLIGGHALVKLGDLGAVPAINTTSFSHNVGDQYPRSIDIDDDGLHFINAASHEYVSIWFAVPRWQGFGMPPADNRVPGFHIHPVGGIDTYQVVSDCFWMVGDGSQDYRWYLPSLSSFGFLYDADDNYVYTYTRPYMSKWDNSFNKLFLLGENGNPCVATNDAILQNEGYYALFNYNNNCPAINQNTHEYFYFFLGIANEKDDFLSKRPAGHSHRAYDHDNLCHGIIIEGDASGGINVGSEFDDPDAVIMIKNTRLFIYIKGMTPGEALKTCTDTAASNIDNVGWSLIDGIYTKSNDIVVHVIIKNRNVI